MLPLEHSSAILSTFIKLPFVIKIFVLSIFEWPLKTGFTGCLFCCFTSRVNSYGHGGSVSSANHTFSWASLNKWLTNTSCIYIRL